MANTFTTDLNFSCPFCSKRCSVDRAQRSIVHELPTCEKFDKLEPDEFLVAVNVAFANKRGVGIS
jgi:hypothetical protein